jgi:hypothetical protein
MSGSVISGSVSSQPNGLYTYTLTIGGLANGAAVGISVFWGVGSNTSGSTDYTVTNGATITITNMPTSADGYVEFIGTDSSGNPISGDLNDYSGGTGAASTDTGGGGCDGKGCPLTRTPGR